jgi:hypothetical protein
MGATTPAPTPTPTPTPTTMGRSHVTDVVDPWDR